MNLKHLSDRTLLSETKKFVAQEREISLHLLHHLKEIERRRAFSDLGYGSLFEYVTRELGYSEASASRRIRSARLIADMPELEIKFESGLLNMNHISMAAQLFKNEDISDKKTRLEVLGKIENKSARDTEKALLEYKGLIEVPKESIKIVTAEITTVKMNLSNETMSLLDELKSVLGHHRFSNDEMMKNIFKVALEEFKKQKFKTNAKLTATSRSPGVTRYIPTIVKKAVYNRDSGKCVKCESRYKLEYDHIRPYAMGGKSSVENLRLLCFSCNQRRNKLSSVLNHPLRN
jgi:hypothetical protein